MSEEWKFGDWYVDCVVDRATVAFRFESFGVGLCHGRDKTEACKWRCQMIKRIVDGEEIMDLGSYRTLGLYKAVYICGEIKIGR